VPQSPENLGQLVKNVAGLCRLLRGEVAGALSLERAGSGDTRFSVLAEDWRDLPFPDLSDEGFSDAYAHTVTFALLLARVERISFRDRSVQEIALLLGKGHSLMGKALAVLTEGLLIGKLSVTVDMLVRVIGAVDWDRLDDHSQDAYLYLYERFLEEYDPRVAQADGLVLHADRCCRIHGPLCRRNLADSTWPSAGLRGRYCRHRGSGDGYGDLPHQYCRTGCPAGRPGGGRGRTTGAFTRIGQAAHRL
jgi:hypothetical protein